MCLQQLGLTLTILPEPMPFLTTARVCRALNLWGGLAEALIVSTMESMDEPLFSSTARAVMASDIICQRVAGKTRERWCLNARQAYLNRSGLPAQESSSREQAAFQEETLDYCQSFTEPHERCLFEPEEAVHARVAKRIPSAAAAKVFQDRPRTHRTRDAEKRTPEEETCICQILRGTLDETDPLGWHDREGLQDRPWTKSQSGEEENRTHKKATHLCQRSVDLFLSLERDKC